MNVTILGAGAMGGALTVPLTDNGHEIQLWGTSHDQEILDTLKNGEPHPRISTKIPESVNILPVESLEKGLENVDFIVLGVSSAGVVPITEKISPYLDGETPLISIAKGFIEYDDRPWMIEDGVRQILRDQAEEVPPVACLGGPSIAQELAERTRTAVEVASRDRQVAERVQGLFETEYFSLRSTDHIDALQTCIGFKNSYSIGLAWPAGLAESEDQPSGGGRSNLNAILFLQTLSELKKVTRLKGGLDETVMGLPGLGDLVTTSGAGRNGTLGRLLGHGLKTEDALQELRNRGVGVIEGYETAKLGMHILDRMGTENNVGPDELPFFYEINQVLYDDKNVVDALEEIPF